MTNSQDISAVASSDLSVLVARLADNKYRLGQRYAEWCTSAPTLESAVAAAAMAQDEIGHARSFYPLLRETATPIGADSDTELEAETRTQFLNARFLDRAFESWTDFIAANLLFDSALTVMLEAATASTFLPLAQRARRIREEESLHWLHAEGWTRRLGEKGEPIREALERSFAAVTPEALGWFDSASPALLEHRIVSVPADELRETFRSRLNAVLGPSGFRQL